MKDKGVRRAEAGMWGGLILMGIGFALTVFAPLAAAFFGRPDASVLFLLGGFALAALGGLVLVFKVVADRMEEQAQDRYSRDVDK
jgi:dipeptide/tripeptide permease